MKRQIVAILHSFYDARLEQKTAEQLYKYKVWYESKKNRTDKVNKKDKNKMRK